MYYRDYKKIAHFLISKQRAHEPEVRRQFLEGFPEPYKSDIVLTLRAKFPDHDRIAGYDLHSTMSAALQSVAAGGFGIADSTAAVARAEVKKEETELVKALVRAQKEQMDRILAFMADVQNNTRAATTSPRPRDWTARAATDSMGRPPVLRGVVSARTWVTSSAIAPRSASTSTAASSRRTRRTSIDWSSRTAHPSPIPFKAAT